MEITFRNVSYKGLKSLFIVSILVPKCLETSVYICPHSTLKLITAQRSESKM